MGQGNTIVSHFVVQRANFIVTIAFLAARAILLSMRVSEDFGCAEKLSAAEQIKPDCRHTPAVVSIFTDSAACVLSFYAPPCHYTTTTVLV